jgi:hypothetical protein
VASAAPFQDFYVCKRKDYLEAKPQTNFSMNSSAIFLQQLKQIFLNYAQASVS